MTLIKVKRTDNTVVELPTSLVETLIGNLSSEFLNVKCGAVRKAELLAEGIKKFADTLQK